MENHEPGKNVELKEPIIFYSNPMYFTVTKSPGAASEDRSWQLQISGMLQTLKITYQICTLL